MSKLPTLTEAQLRMVRFIINTGDIADHLAHKCWTFCCPTSNGLMWIPNNYNDAIRALISMRILVPEITDKEFKVQHALGTLNIRRYHLKDKQKWYGKLKDLGLML